MLSKRVILSAFARKKCKTQEFAGEPDFKEKSYLKISRKSERK